jgi:hypothetical protein
MHPWKSLRLPASVETTVTLYSRKLCATEVLHPVACAEVKGKQNVPDTSDRDVIMAGANIQNTSSRNLA